MTSTASDHVAVALDDDLVASGAPTGRGAISTSIPTRSRSPLSICEDARRRHRQRLPRRRRLRRRGPFFLGPSRSKGPALDYGIRGVHLAYELLDGYDALVLIDAVPLGEGTGHRRRVGA